MSTNWDIETQELDTILDFYRFAISKANAANLYYGHGTDNSEDDMRSLILGSLHLPWETNPTLLGSRLTASEKSFLCEQLAKRIDQRIPVPYLIHEAFFCDLPFYVDERVLIPRSPVAELIEQQFLPWVKPDQVKRILDLCTGSACIAIACCYAFPEAQVDAVDISEDALAVARINQEKLEVSHQLHVILSDCFDALSGEPYDIIISNPPYVGSEEMQSLPAEYLHEPNLALEALDQGLAIVAKILKHAHDYLTDNGVLIVEVGNSQIAVLETWPDVPFTWLEFERGGQGVFLLTRQQLQKYFAS